MSILQVERHPGRIDEIHQEICRIRKQLKLLIRWTKKPHSLSRMIWGIPEFAIFMRRAWSRGQWCIIDSKKSRIGVLSFAWFAVTIRL